MMKKIFTPTLGLLMTLVCSAAWAGATPGAWEKLLEEDGIIVYRKEVAGSPIVAFKGEGMIDAPLNKVAAVVFDSERAKEWVDSLEENRLLHRTSAVDWVEYSHVGTPFVMKDRDFVSRITVEVDEKANAVTEHVRSVEDTAAPKTDYVRGELLDSTFALYSREGGKKTYVMVEIHADPKGAIPKWIVNLFQEDWPKNTIQALRKQSAKEDIRPLAQYTLITR